MSAPHLLIYDIPKAAKIPNPTAWLRAIAVRINKSVWVIQEDVIPLRELQNLEEAGARWYTLPFDTKAMGDITKLVIESLTQEIRGVVERSRESCDKATLAAQRSKKPLTERIIAHRRKVTPIIKKMGKTLTALRKAALTFGVPREQIGFHSAVSAIETLRETMLERAKAMMEAAREFEQAEPNSPMAKAARNSAVPAAILADYLADRGMRSEKKLRTIFD